MGNSRLLKIAGLVDHDHAAGKAGQRGTPSRRAATVARAPQSA